MRHYPYILTLLLMLASTHALEAQGLRWTITPKVGFFAPLSDLSESGESSSKLASSLALGLALEVDFPAAPISLRANVDVATNSKVESNGIETLAADQLNLVGDLLIRPFSRQYIVQPFLLVGAGMKRYSFSDDEFDLSSSEQAFTGHVGGGVILDFGHIKLSGELSDYISSRDVGASGSLGQHDLFGMLGLRIPISK